ncbi:helix-turn-helix transcriptional regulator [Neiella marina]|uniref:Helix-turn-helix transcriptional regulator n=1 Tax=Neiella holothuriorum TaxID=2870530 RepID=A0ABS7EE11_9GAMM|nr:helix-turn-helix domain-containing protein [Neiella holothuriorum]MBW8190558.1 helix-turn-helix transcriptional regulator [Neiella holothuriorum]
MNTQQTGRRRGSYGQACPMAMAAEFLCVRWSMLILRELIAGATSFNDISRGVSKMSRSLLSQRLKEFVSRGIITKQTSPSGYDQYELTKAGKGLGNVVASMGCWSQEWMSIEPSLVDIDADNLMWNIRRSAKPHPDLPNPFVVEFFMPDQKLKFQHAWLVFQDNKVDLCTLDNDFDIDVQIEATAEVLTKVYMGWDDFDDAVKSHQLTLRGSEPYLKLTKLWMGRSVVADIKKQPKALRVG